MPNIKVDELKAHIGERESLVSSERVKIIIQPKISYLKKKTDFRVINSTEQNPAPDGTGLRCSVLSSLRRFTCNNFLRREPQNI